MTLWAGIGLGLQGTSAVLSAIAAGRAKTSYTIYQNNVRQAALNNYLYQTRAINNRYSEEQEASSINQQQVEIENMKAKATAETSAAGSGVAGTTIDNLFKDYDRASAMSNYVAQRNLQIKGYQYNDELDSARISALNSYNTLQDYTGGNGWDTLFSGIGNMLMNYTQDSNWAKLIEKGNVR